MPTWSYIDRAQQHLPILGMYFSNPTTFESYVDQISVYLSTFVGAFHASDLPAVVGLVPGKRTNDYQSMWLSFAHHLDPNFPSLPNWSTYESQNVLVIDKHGSVGMEPDDFRSSAIDYYLSNIDTFTFVSP